jgi:hypothetical protein
MKPIEEFLPSVDLEKLLAEVGAEHPDCNEPELYRHLLAEVEGNERWTRTCILYALGVVMRKPNEQNDDQQEQQQERLRRLGENYEVLVNVDEEQLPLLIEGAIKARSIIISVEAV